MSQTEVQRALSNWSELEALAGHDVGERAYVERLLELWCEALPATGAALYLDRSGDAGSPLDERKPGGDGFVRELTVGDGAFPPTLESAADEPFAYRISGGLLLARPGSGEAAAGEAAAGAPAIPPPAPEPHTLLMTSAVRALRLRGQLKRQHFQVNYRVVELESVYEVGLAIASTLDLEQLSEEILLRAVSLLDARRGAFYRREGDVYRLDRTFGGAAKEALDVADPALEPLLGGDDGAPEGLVPGARHLMAVAIGTGKRPRGLIVVGDKESRHGVGPFGASERRTLSLFANQAAIALENAQLHRQALEKERLEREIELAAEIQRQILPDPSATPQVEGWELLGWNRPARQVGGDYYDIFRRDGRLVLTVADVTGKGMPAALLVSTLHSALHLLLDRVPLGPELLSRLNEHVLGSSAANKFITLLLAELDVASGELTYVNAGHNPGLLLRGGGSEVEELEPCGLPLGLLPGSTYRSGRLEMRRDDLLCLFTDGITECAAPDDEEFGDGRLVDFLVGHHGASLPDLAAHLDQECQTFAAGQPQLDDQTVVLVRRG